MPDVMGDVIKPIRGRWYHLVFTYDEDGNKAYIDGEFVSTWKQVQPHTITSDDGSIWIGGVPGLDNHFNGWISQFAIFNRALNHGEIRSVYGSYDGLRYRDFKPVPTKVSPSKMLRLYKLEGSFTDSVNGPGEFDLIPNGSPIFVKERPFGTKLRNVLYTGIGQRATAITLGLPSGSSKRTMMVWFKPRITRDIDGGAFGYGYRACNKVYQAWYVRNQNSLEVDQGCHNEGTGKVISNVMEQWYHLTFTFDGTNHTAYVDGLLVSSGTPDISPNSITGPDGVLNIGGNMGPGDAFIGWFADFAIFERVLPASEIKQIYSADGGLLYNEPVVPYRTSKPSGMLRLYKLDDNTGFTDSVNGAGEFDLIPDGNPNLIKERPFGGKFRKVLYVGKGQKATAIALGLPGGASPRTIMGWFKPHLSRVIGNGPFGYGDDACNTAYYALIHDTDKLKLDQLCEESGTGNVAVKMGEQWIHVAFTYDGVKNSAYLDGSLVSSGEPSIRPNTVSSIEGLLQIGGRFNSGNDFAGWVAEVAVFNRALTEVEINDVFTANGGLEYVDYETEIKTIAPAGMLRLYKLNNFVDSVNGAGEFDLTAAGTGSPTFMKERVMGTKYKQVMYVSGGQRATGTALGLPSGDTKRTMMMWFKPETSKGQESTLIGYCKRSPENGFLMYLMNDGSFVNDIVSIRSSAAASDLREQWYHMAVTYDGQNSVIYVDGNHALTHSFGSINTVASSDALVYFGWENRPFHGWIADFAVFNRVLSSQEISNVYNTNGGLAFVDYETEINTIAPAGMLRLYKLDDFEDSVNGAGEFDLTSIGTGSSTFMKERIMGTKYTQVMYLSGKQDAKGTALGLPSGDTKRTMMFWLKPETSKGDISFSFGYYKESAGNGFYMFYDHDGDLHNSIYGNNSPVAASGFKERWYHITVTYDGQNSVIYVDGNHALTHSFGSINTVASSDSLLHIGDVVRTFNGWVADFAVFNRVLSPQEISNVYNTNGGLAFVDYETEINTIAPAGMLRLYKLDDFEDSVNGAGEFDLTAAGTGSPTFMKERVMGTKYKQVMYVSGGQRATGTALGLPSGDTKRTMMMWFKPETSKGQESTLIGYCKRSPENGFLMYLMNDGSFVNDIVSIRSSAAASDLREQWYHMAVTYDGQNSVIYVDGNHALTHSFGSINTVASSDALVYFGWENRPFHGWVADFAVFNRVLSPQEISNVYNTNGGLAFVDYETEIKTIAPPGMLRLYKLDDFEDSVNGAGEFDLTSIGTGSPTFMKERVMGTKYKQVIYISGGQRATGAAFGLPSGETKRTMMVWFKPETSKGTVSPLIGYGRYACGSGFMLRLVENALVNDRFCAFGDSVLTATEMREQWYHIAITYDGELSSLYLDGIFKVTNYAGSIDTVTNSQEDLTVGGEFDLSTPFHGWIADFAVFNRVLSSQEISDVYNANGGLEYVDYETEITTFSPPGMLRLYKLEDMIDSINGDGVANLKYNGQDAPSFTKDRIMGTKFRQVTYLPNSGSTLLCNLAFGLPSGNSHRTMMGWFKPDVGSNDFYFIGYGSSDHMFATKVHGNEILMLSGQNSWKVYDELRLRHQWYHFAATYDGVNIENFLNGEKIFTKPYSPLNTGATFFTIANHKGWVADAAYFDRVLTQQEISDVYNANGGLLFVEADEGVKNIDGMLRLYKLDHVVGYADSINGPGEFDLIARGTTLIWDRPYGVRLRKVLYTAVGTRASGITLGLPSGDKPRSIICWMKPNEFLPAIFVGYGRSAPYHLFSMGMHYHGVIAGVNYNSDFQVNVIPANQWYHVAYTYDGSQRALYVNGELMKTDNRECNTVTSSGAKLNIGGFASLTEDEFHGSVADVAIFNRALTAQEVKDIYGSHGGLKYIGSEVNITTVEPPDLERLYKLDDPKYGHLDLVNGPGKRNLKLDDLSVYERDLPYGTLFRQVMYLKVGSRVKTTAKGLPAGSSPRTVMGWFKPSGGDDLKYTTIFGYGEKGCGKSYLLMVDGYGDMVLNQGCDGNELDSIIVSPKEQWYHVVVTFDGSKNVAYVDGQLIKSAPPQNTPNTVSTSTEAYVSLGDRDDGRTDGFTGWVADFTVAERALTAEEVGEVYKSNGGVSFTPDITGVMRDLSLYSYMGCYQDYTDRALSKYIGNEMKTSECYFACVNGGYYYFGLTEDRKCFCGEMSKNGRNWARYGRADDCECNKYEIGHKKTCVYRAWAEHESPFVPEVSCMTPDSDEIGAEVKLAFCAEGGENVYHFTMFKQLMHSSGYCVEIMEFNGKVGLYLQECDTGKLGQFMEVTSDCDEDGECDNSKIGLGFKGKCSFDIEAGCYDGNLWNHQMQPASKIGMHSCEDVRAVDPEAPNGVYNLAPDGSREVFCDNNTDKRIRYKAVLTLCIGGDMTDDYHEKLYIENCNGEKKQDWEITSEGLIVNQLNPKFCVCALQMNQLVHVRACDCSKGLSEHLTKWYVIGVNMDIIVPRNNTDLAWQVNYTDPSLEQHDLILAPTIGGITQKFQL